MKHVLHGLNFLLSLSLTNSALGGGQKLTIDFSAVSFSDTFPSCKKIPEEDRRLLNTVFSSNDHLRTIMIAINKNMVDRHPFASDDLLLSRIQVLRPSEPMTASYRGNIWRANGSKHIFSASICEEGVRVTIYALQYKNILPEIFTFPVCRFSQDDSEEKDYKEEKEYKEEKLLDQGTNSDEDWENIDYQPGAINRID